MMHLDEGGSARLRTRELLIFTPITCRSRIKKVVGFFYCNRDILSRQYLCKKRPFVFVASTHRSYFKLYILTKLWIGHAMTI
jgi:hypothetical protein